MRTLEEINAELAQLAEHQARRKKALSAYDDLEKQRRERKNTERETAIALEKEHADVEELERMSLKALLAMLKGDKEERLSRERREELTAKLRHDQAVRDLEEIERRIAELNKELGQLPDRGPRMQALLEEKAEILRAQGGEQGVRLAELERELAETASRRRELREAMDAGREVLYAVGAMEESLDDAAAMGTWDMLGGGFFATAAKHQHLDEARYAADGIQRAMSRFRTELADVVVPIETPTVEVGEFATFADYFFDGFFADWAVQSRIHDAQGGVAHTRDRVEQVMDRLQGMDGVEQAHAVDLEMEREELLRKC